MSPGVLRVPRAPRSPGPGLLAALLLAASGCDAPRGEPVAPPATPSSTTPRWRPSAAARPGAPPSATPSSGAAAAAAPSAGATPPPLAREALPASATPPPLGPVRAEPAGPVHLPEDAERWRALATLPITSAAPNAGGATLTLRLRLADGSRALFKPAQRHSASNHRAELVAYHLDRALGLGRVAVVVGTRLPRAALRAWLAERGAQAAWLARYDAELRDEAGWVEGALIDWHAGRLVALPMHARDAAALALPSAPEPSPEGGLPPPLDGGAAEGGAPPWSPARLAELSDLIVFDALLDNTDRWSGGNVLALGEQGPMIFLDNAAGLSRRSLGLERPPLRLAQRVCRWRRSTVAALRAFAPPSEGLGAWLARSLRGDPLALGVSAQQLAWVEQRAGLVLAQVERCLAREGEARVLPW